MPPSTGTGSTAAGGTFESDTGGTYQSDTPGTFQSVTDGTFHSAMTGTFQSDTGGTSIPLLSLTNAKKVAIIPAKKNANQKSFDKMIMMEYNCTGIGIIKMTLGIRRGSHEKIQYCITALEDKKGRLKPSL